MSNDIFFGSATVPTSGYAWIDGATADWDVDVDEDGFGGASINVSYARYLIPVPTRDRKRGPASKTYDPLVDEDGLFLDFAWLPVSEEAVLKFANRYGWLGNPGIVLEPDDVRDLHGDVDSEDFDYVVNLTGLSGESLDRWRPEIALLRPPVALWQGLRSGQIKVLSKAISRDARGNYRRDPGQLKLGEDLGPLSIRTIRPDDNDSLRFEELPENDPRPAALVYLRQAVAARVTRIGIPELRWSGERLALKFRSTGLLQTLWLQFARAIEGNKEYERCKHCLKYFEIGQSAARKGKTYCSDACRTAA